MSAKALQTDSNRSPEKVKVFKVFRISDNTNSFGLTGHWLMARDGETWEVARYQRWQMGEQIPAWLDPVTGEPDWARLSCEIPERKSVPKYKDKDGTPAEVIAEVWND